VLSVFYDLEIVEEDALLAWGESTSESTFLSLADDMLRWLREADEEESEEDSEEESGDESE